MTTTTKREAERTSLSTAKATSSTPRPQTCTEVATKYYNYTANKPVKRGNTECQRFKKRWGDQATLEVYNQRQAARVTRSVQCTSRIPFQRTEDSRSVFKPWATMGFTVSFILEHWICVTCREALHLLKSFSFTIFVTFTSLKLS